MRSKTKSKTRETLAQAFLVELIKKKSFEIKPDDNTHRALARGAVKYADELIRALNE